MALTRLPVKEVATAVAAGAGLARGFVMALDWLHVSRHDAGVFVWGVMAGATAYAAVFLGLRFMARNRQRRS